VLDLVDPPLQTQMLEDRLTLSQDHRLDTHHHQR
jgi:hypothetical protein